jgi:hypothetical protein
MARNLKALFKTDKGLEKKGVEIDYNFAVITVARAGGSTTTYKKALNDAVQPFRQALQAGLIDESSLQDKFIRLFADHIVLDWRTRRSDGTLVQGLAEGDTDGELLPFTPDNVFKYLKDTVELYEDLEKQASARKLFLKDLEAAAGN